MFIAYFIDSIEFLPRVLRRVQAGRRSTRADVLKSGRKPYSSRESGAADAFYIARRSKLR